jgi:serine protease Do
MRILAIRPIRSLVTPLLSGGVQPRARYGKGARPHPQAPIALVIALVVSLLVCVGCAPNKRFLVSTDPPGADVFVDGSRVGSTPLMLETNDLMPNRAADGLVSAQARLSFEKAGYESERVVLSEWSIPDELSVPLRARPIFSRHYDDFLQNNPALNESTQRPRQAPRILTSPDLDADSERLFGEGYVMIGYLGLAADDVPTEAVSRQAIAVGAEVVLVHSRYSGTETRVRSVTAKTRTRVVTSFGSTHGNLTETGTLAAQVHGAGQTFSGSGSYSRIARASAFSSGYTILPSESRTVFVPFSERQYDYQIAFWRKRKSNRMGAHTELIPLELRRVLGRNTGAMVVAVEAKSPAFYADVLVGDVVVSLDGSDVREPDEFVRLAEQARGRFELVVLRDGKRTLIVGEVH